jgi:hypothetical protein
MLGGANPELDNTKTENSSEMKNEPEETELHKLTKVHNFLEMWQASHNLYATQKQSHIQTSR